MKNDYLHSVGKESCQHNDYLLVKNIPDMKEIGSIYLGRINNGAHFIFMKNILEQALADTAVSTRAAAQVTALKAAMTQEDKDLKISRKSLLSDDIALADAKRDSLYRGYRRVVAGFRDSPVASMAQAAKVLHQHIKDYGISPKMQLDEETGLLINFIADLEEKYKTEVEALSLTPYVSALKTVNEQLRTLMASRAHEKAGIRKGALKASRKATDAAYRMLVKMVNALALVEGEADYAAFIDFVNAQIRHFKRDVLGQKSPSKKTAEGGEANKTDGGDAPVGGGSDVPVGENGTAPISGSSDVVRCAVETQNIASPSYITSPSYIASLTYIASPSYIASPTYITSPTYIASHKIRRDESRLQKFRDAIFCVSTDPTRERIYPSNARPSLSGARYPSDIVRHAVSARCVPGAVETQNIASP